DRRRTAPAACATGRAAPVRGWDRKVARAAAHLRRARSARRRRPRPGHPSGSALRSCARLRGLGLLDERVEQRAVVLDRAAELVGPCLAALAGDGDRVAGTVVLDD